MEVAEEKINIISFSRFRKHENSSFEFLGFEYRWAVSHKGKDITPGFVRGALGNQRVYRDYETPTIRDVL